ncbi:MAG: tRNA pseudouridine(13) synthase TruD [Phycisphaerae bacterium]
MDAMIGPYLTEELPGIGGKIKDRPEDFRVDELPLYEPSGEGTHLYFRVTKRGLPTPEAVRLIARRLGVRPTGIGYAGNKDAQAVTTQLMSVEHVSPEKLAGFEDDRIAVEPLGLHTNKLRPGHLAGNRFTIRIRDVDASAEPAARRVLDVLVARGVPNYFGPQRFGQRGETGKLGEALVRNDLDTFLSLLLGSPGGQDSPAVREAREHFEAGDYEAALQSWPGSFTEERRALKAYVRRGRPTAAVGALDKRRKRLFVSAFQSEIFNAVLARRLDSIDRLFDGDLAMKHDNGAVFRVEDAAVEQPRADRFEISPTGPVPGSRCELADGPGGEIERAVLAERGFADDLPKKVGSLRLSGTRRALRFMLAEPELSAGSDEHGDYLELCFTADTGCYATCALREIMKLRNED